MPGCGRRGRRAKLGRRPSRLRNRNEVGFAKLYDRKTPICAAELLNDRVIPFFDEHEVPLLRILTDRGTEYCGNPERHEYELYLAVENIDHSRTKTKSPQTNGIAERFHKTTNSIAWRSARGLDRGVAARPGCLDAGVQRDALSSGPMVLRKDADGDLP